MKLFFSKIKLFILKIFNRATVYGLWVPEAPYRVSSGYITKDTKVKKKILFDLLFN
jgi:hypothetical protein